MQSVLWSGSVGLTPVIHALPAGLVAIPVTDLPPSQLVVAWPSARPGPLVRSFAQIAAAVFRPVRPAA
jgi:hypothetical protein